MRKSSQNLHLTDMFTRQQFRQIETAFKRKVGLALETCDIHGREIRSLCSTDCRPAFCKRLRQSKIAAQRCKQNRLRSLNISIETGLPHITVCHAGIALVCIPMMEGNLPLGGLFFGKCLFQPLDQTLELDVQNRLRGLQIYQHEIFETLNQLPVVSARRIHEAADFLYVLLYETASLDPPVIRSRRLQSVQPSRNNNDIEETKLLDVEASAYDLECQLIARVKIGDRAGSREILNALLDEIISPPADTLNLLKARLIELLGVLTRAAAASGVDITALLRNNIDYIHKALTLDTQEGILLWISQALEDFTKTVYHFQDTPKMSQLKPAIEYMQYNYSEPLTLADIAKTAHLSVSRLGHLFREQMGITVVDYLTHLRINHAKRLLLSTEHNCTRIGYDVGYNNQSYFTRVFKQITGVTPRQFRNQNAKKYL